MSTSNTAAQGGSSPSSCSPCDDARSDEADYCLEAYEEAASHLEILAKDLETGLEKNCLLRVAKTIRKAGRLAYGPDLCHDPDVMKANVSDQATASAKLP